MKNNHFDELVEVNLSPDAMWNVVQLSYDFFRQDFPDPYYRDVTGGFHYKTKGLSFYLAVMPDAMRKGVAQVASITVYNDEFYASVFDPVDALHRTHPFVGEMVAKLETRLQLLPVCKNPLDTMLANAGRRSQRPPLRVQA